MEILFPFKLLRLSLMLDLLEEIIAHGLLTSTPGPPLWMLILLEPVSFMINSLRVKAFLLATPTLSFLFNISFDSFLFIHFLLNLQPFLLLRFLDPSGHGLIRLLQSLVFLLLLPPKTSFCFLLSFNLVPYAISEHFLLRHNLLLCSIHKWQSFFRLTIQSSGRSLRPDFFLQFIFLDFLSIRLSLVFLL